MADSKISDLTALTAAAAADPPPQCARVLGRGLRFRRVDRHAVDDAPTGNLGFYFSRSARKPA